jgi:MFS family permease
LAWFAYDGPLVTIRFHDRSLEYSLLYTFRERIAAGRGNRAAKNIENIGQFHFNWKWLELFKKPPDYYLLFFGVFPWNAITYWFFIYLERERNYSSEEIFPTMVLAVLVLAAGYPIGGALGDFYFKRNPRGRLIVSTIGVAVGAILLAITLNIPLEDKLLFMISLSLTALFIPIAASNVLATILISRPGQRSSGSEQLSSLPAALFRY